MCVALLGGDFLFFLSQVCQTYVNNVSGKYKILGYIPKNGRCLSARTFVTFSHNGLVYLGILGWFKTVVNFKLGHPQLKTPRIGDRQIYSTPKRRVSHLMPTLY